jgi:hypothetical protein
LSVSAKALPKNFQTVPGKCARILADVAELHDGGRGEPGRGLLKDLWSKLTDVATRCGDDAERNFVISLRASKRAMQTRWAA